MSRAMKTIIERGASWTLEETKLLLQLWGQDLISRQSNKIKRTKEVYETISEKFELAGFDRTPDQVRTRVFNMIAEYRRILKDPNPERQKKCVFFEPLHRIYHASTMDEIKTILDEYEPDAPLSPSSNVLSEKGDGSISDGDATERNDTVNNTSSSVTATSTIKPDPTQTNSNSSSSSTSVHVNNNDTSNSTAATNISDLTIIDANVTKEEEKLTSQILAEKTIPPKRIRLQSPISGHNQAHQTTSVPAAGNSTISPQDNATNPSTSSKQTKSQTVTSVPLIATTTIGATPISSTSTIRTQQSLLMPHATAPSAPSTSTPVTKFTTSANNNTPSYININSTKLPIIRTNQIIGPNGNESINLTNGTTTRLPTTAAITSHQLYQAPVNTFDVTSSALLIDRMFSHLSRESENMREWIALEKERLAIEKTRRQQETEREFRRERVLMDTLMKFQDQWLAFLSRIDPRIVENSGQALPELIPLRPDDGNPLSTNTATYSMLSNNNKDNNSNSNSTSKQAETDKQ